MQIGHFNFKLPQSKREKKAGIKPAFD